jgi:sec-independent protein translocase protein TatA
MGPVGWQEMVVIFIVALVLFGPKKLPELGRTLGRAISEFRRASNELKSTFEREMQSLEREGESLKEITRGYTNEIYNHYESGYSSPYEAGEYGPDPYYYDSTATNPSTVSESASKDAEQSSEEAAAAPLIPGTVARTPGTETATGNTEVHAAGDHPAEHGPALKPQNS